MKIKTLGVIMAITIILFIFVLTRLVKLNSQCDANPFVYGAQNLADQGISAECSCTLQKEYGAGAILNFNKDGATIINSDSQSLNTVEFLNPYD